MRKEKLSSTKHPIPSDVTRSSERELGADELATVVGGRDAASGLPTGKRMHKPF
jgi:hypothetical protein